MMGSAPAGSALVRRACSTISSSNARSWQPVTTPVPTTSRSTEGAQMTSRLFPYSPELRPRPAADLRAELMSAVRRYDDAGEAVSTARGLRRRELLRVACADLLGLLDTTEVGQALSDVTSATLDAVLDAVLRQVQADRATRGEPGTLPMKIAI